MKILLILVGVGVFLGLLTYLTMEPNSIVWKFASSFRNGRIAGLRLRRPRMAPYALPPITPARLSPME